MKKLIWIIPVCFFFVETACAQEYIEITRPYKIYHNSNSPNAYIQLFPGEIYLGPRNVSKTGRVIKYGNLELVVPYIASDEVYRLIGKPEDKAAVANRDAIFQSRLDSIITRQFISGREQFYFDLRGIKQDNRTIYLASNTEKKVTFKNENSYTVANLDGTFPHEWIRFIAAGMPTQFAEKAEMKNLEPIYDFDRENYTEHIAANGQIYLKRKANRKIITTNEKYLSQQAVSDTEIELKDGQFLRIDIHGFGEITKEGSSTSSLNNYLLGLGIIALLGVIFWLLSKRDKGNKPRMGKKSSWWQIFPKKRFSPQGPYGRSGEAESIFHGTEPGPEPEPLSKDAPENLRPITDALESHFYSMEKGLFELSKKFSVFENLLISRQQNPEILNENKRLKGRVDELTAILDSKEVELKRSVQNTSKYAHLSQSIDQLTGAERFANKHLQIFESLNAIENKIKHLISQCNAAPQLIDETMIIMSFFSKYTSNKNQTALYRWQTILHGLVENGLITDRELMGRITRGESTEEKLETMERQIHKELYLDYVSALMILLEELRNLEHFAKIFSEKPHKGVIAEAQNISVEMKALTNRLKQVLNIDIYYVPLFDIFRDHTNDVNLKTVDDPHFFLYKHLKNKPNFDRNAIMEIVSCGMKSDHVDEPTKVILAK